MTTNDIQSDSKYLYDEKINLTSKKLLSYKLPTIGSIQLEFPWGDFTKILFELKKNLPSSKVSDKLMISHPLRHNT
jgi:hypothetical protein